MIQPSRLTTLFALSLLFRFTHSVSATIIPVDENMNDNLVPSGFSLTTVGTAGLANGRLEASSTNGSASLSYENVPDNLNQIDISYSGHFGYSFWGTFTEVTLIGTPISLIHGVKEFNEGQNNFARINGGGSTNTSPFNFADFEYAITVIDGQVSYTGTDTATNNQEFSLIYNDTGILLADITQINFRSHNTTGNEPVWLDNIKMQLHTTVVPEPGSLSLMVLGLAGLGFIRRKKTKTA